MQPPEPYVHELHPLCNLADRVPIECRQADVVVTLADLGFFFVAHGY